MNEPVRERVVDIGHGIPWLQAPGWLNRFCFTLLERVLGYHLINRLYAEAAAGDAGKHYLARLVEKFGFEPRIDGLEESGWPAKGPVIVVANHPFGGADATVVGDLAFRRRADTRIIANEFLGAIEPLAPSLISVNVYGGAEAARSNRRGLRETAEHLKKGGQLVVFPAGEVASWSWKDKEIVEPPWADHAVTLARKFDAAIIPIFVKGRNSILFQILGLIHPFLRTAWLGREYLGRRGKPVELVVHRAIEPGSLDEGDPTGGLRQTCLRESGDN